MLERLIDYINGHDGVKWMTFEEIADDFRKRFPFAGRQAPGSHLRPRLLQACRRAARCRPPFHTRRRSCARAAAFRRRRDTGPKPARQRRMTGCAAVSAARRCCTRSCRAYGLTAHDGAQVPGIQIGTLSGNQIDRARPRGGLDRGREAGRTAVDPLDPRFIGDRRGRVPMDAMPRPRAADDHRRLSRLGQDHMAPPPTPCRQLRRCHRRRQRGGGNAGRRCAAARRRAARGAGRRLRLLRGNGRARWRCCADLCDERSRVGSSAAMSRRRSCWKPAALPIRVRSCEAIRADPVLVHHIVVSEIVVTVDALYGLAPSPRASRWAAGRSRLADRLVVTKVGCRRRRALEASCWRRLPGSIPGAVISGAAKGEPTCCCRHSQRRSRSRWAKPMAGGDAIKPHPASMLGDDVGLDGLHRLAVARCCMRAATTSCGSRAWSNAGRAAAAAKRAQDGAVAGNPAAAGR